MVDICPRCSELSLLLASFPKATKHGKDSFRPLERAASDDSFCVKVTSETEVSKLILTASDVSAYFVAPTLWRAGTLRWSAWAIVVGERGVYVQGSAGPLYGIGSRRNLAPC